MNKNNFVKKIYREKEVDYIQSKLDKIVSDMDAITFMNIRLISTIVLFFIVLYCFRLGYIFSPIVCISFFYIFTYLFLDYRLKNRAKELDRDALNFFEILTLTLESGRDLERSIEVTCFNVNSELSEEFKRTLFEVKFGKSLLEALNDMKKRIPSETINNIILNITQTNIFGNSIVETMYNQVEFLREKQILSVKEQINKIPNKISIISVLFVVPLIIMMILGPFLINFLK